MVEQRGGGQLVAADGFCGDRDGLLVGVRAASEGDWVRLRGVALGWARASAGVGQRLAGGRRRCARGLRRCGVARGLARSTVRVASARFRKANGSSSYSLFIAPRPICSCIGAASKSSSSGCSGRGAAAAARACAKGAAAAAAVPSAVTGAASTLVRGMASYMERGALSNSGTIETGSSFRRENQPMMPASSVLPPPPLQHGLRRVRLFRAPCAKARRPFRVFAPKDLAGPRLAFLRARLTSSRRVRQAVHFKRARVFNEGDVVRDPLARAVEGKRGGKIERQHHHQADDEHGSREVEEVNHQVRDEASAEPGDGQRVTSTAACRAAARWRPGQRKSKAAARPTWRSTEPTARERSQQTPSANQEKWKQEGRRCRAAAAARPRGRHQRLPVQLCARVAGISADRVEGDIGRRVADQREQQQGRRDQHEDAENLIQAAIPRRGGSSYEELSSELPFGGRCRLRGQGLGSLAPTPANFITAERADEKAYVGRVGIQIQTLRRDGHLWVRQYYTGAVQQDGRRAGKRPYLRGESRCRSHLRGRTQHVPEQRKKSKDLSHVDRFEQER